ncbi:MAG: biopolymer transporter ExbD [Bacteroidota bacterium]
MAKFARKGKGGTPAISTASLPDIVFMLLFFFMVSTTMREVDLKIRVKLPQATEIKKLEKKSLVSYIYVGAPIEAYKRKYGTEPRLQLNDELSQVSDIIPYISAEREKMDEVDIPYMTTSIKADMEVKMGIITEIKQELRKASALKINYSARKAQ